MPHYDQCLDRTLKLKVSNFPGDSVVKNSPANATDTGLITGLGGSQMPWASYACCAPQLLVRTLEPLEP